LFIDQAIDLLCFQLLRDHSSLGTKPQRTLHRGLPTWQVKRISEYMRDNLDRGFRRAAGQTYPKLAARFERLKSWIPNLKSGDKFIVTYRPNLGLEVRHGAKALGSIDGADFATTLFSIWLGDHPPNEGLKTGLLGGPCG